MSQRQNIRSDMPYFITSKDPGTQSHTRHYNFHRLEIYQNTCTVGYNKVYSDVITSKLSKQPLKTYIFTYLIKFKTKLSSTTLSAAKTNMEHIDV